HLKHNMMMNNKLKPFLALALFGTLATTSCQKKDSEQVSPTSEMTPSGAEAARSANVTYEETMEGSNPFSTAYEIEKGSMSYGLTFVNGPAFSGSKSARYELHDTDPLESTGKRVEAAIVKGAGKNVWYSFAQFR